MSKDPYRPVVRTQADLEEVWRTLMQPLGFGEHSIWMMLVLPDGQAIPELTQITEAEQAPRSRAELESFAHLLRHVQPEPGTRFAFLRSRPGHGIDSQDRAWAGFFYRAGRVAGVPIEVVHLATDDRIVPLPRDEVELRRPA